MRTHLQETCACGASITLTTRGYPNALAAAVAWRAGHRHATPAEPMPDPADFRVDDKGGGAHERAYAPIGFTAAAPTGKPR